MAIFWGGATWGQPTFVLEFFSFHCWHAFVRDIGSILSLGLLSKNQTNVQITLQNHNSLSCLFLGSCHQFVSHFICGDSRGVWGVSNTIKRIKRVRHVQNNILSYIFNVFLGHMFIQLLWTWECSSKNFQITTPANLYCIRFES
jgi:hypothetical protein